MKRTNKNQIEEFSKVMHTSFRNRRDWEEEAGRWKGNGQRGFFYPIRNEHAHIHRRTSYPCTKATTISPSILYHHHSLSPHNGKIGKLYTVLHNAHRQAGTSSVYSFSALPISTSIHGRTQVHCLCAAHAHIRTRKPIHISHSLSCTPK